MRGGSPGPAATVDVSNKEGVDDGTTLTLWTRAPLESQAKLLVEAYNASHKNQVELTVVPNDDYVAKVGAAAGSGELPDLFAADVVYLPNWTSRACSPTSRSGSTTGLQGPDQQVRARRRTYEDKQYVLPFVLDLSVMFYNKDLYREAGHGPGQGPDHAHRVPRPGPGHPEAEQAGHLRHLLRRQLRRLRRLHLVSP